MNRLLLAILLLGATPSARAQEPAGFDAKAAALWRGVGAKVGWLPEDKRGWRLFQETRPDQPALPAVRWPGGKPFEFGLIASLPVPSGPFAFDLNRTNASGKELRELARFKNLEALDLDQTYVTDADLQEIAHLTSLKSLYIRYTKASDAGVKTSPASPGCTRSASAAPRSATPP
ncbi:MAG: hypothetical protein U0793_00785 [Gemmataceae bacterium]